MLMVLWIFVGWATGWLTGNSLERMVTSGF